MAPRLRRLSDPLLLVVSNERQALALEGHQAIVPLHVGPDAAGPLAAGRQLPYVAELSALRHQRSPRSSDSVR